MLKEYYFKEKYIYNNGDYKLSKFRQFIIICILYAIIVSGVIVSKAEIQIIYDDITLPQYKMIQLQSDVCEQVSVVYTCKHKVYLNGMFLGVFQEGEGFQVPDGSSVRIDLDEPVNTNLENVPEEVKSSFVIWLMMYIQPFLIIVVFVALVWLAVMGYRGYRKRYWNKYW